jgi:hypothetical protein
MARSYDFAEAALVGQQVALTLLAKLVDRGIILPADAADVLDQVLLELEEWQASFPEYQQGFELAREHLSQVIDAYRAMPRRPTE